MTIKVVGERMPEETKSYWQPLYGGPRGTYDSFHGQAEPGDLALVAAYEDIVYSCVSLIASNIATSGIRLYVRTATGQRHPKCDTRPVAVKNLSRIRQKHFGQDIKEVVEHPLLELVKKCNPFHNKLDFAELTQMYLDLTGNSYWLMQFNKLGIPNELYLLPSQYVSAERDENYFVKAWRFGQGLEQRCYSTEQVIHFRYGNPLDTYGKGVSPLRGAWGRVQVGRKELSYLDNTLSNMGRPDTVIAIKDSIAPFEAERVAKEWYQRYEGHGAGGPLVVDGTISVQPIAYPPKDLAELQLYQVIKTTVSNCFHIPPELWELGASTTYAAADTARYLFALNCLQPRLDRLAHTLNDRLVPYFDCRFFFEFDNVVPEDQAYELQKVQMLLSQQVITRDEARQLYGFDSQDWAREPLLPSGVMPADVFSQPEEDEEPATPLLDNTQPEQQQGATDATASLRATVGGSQQVTALQQAVIAGTLTRDMAIANARLVFGFSAEEAEILFPKDTPVKQDQPAPQQEPLGLAYKDYQTRCGGEGGKPGPCPEPGGENPTGQHDEAAHKERQRKVAAALGGVIDRTSSLTPEQKADFKNATHSVISNMTPKALDRFSKSVKKLRYHGSVRGLTDQVMAEDEKLRAKLGVKFVIKGAYEGKTGLLDLDGPSTLEGKQLTTNHFYAHEFSHAIDGPSHEISKSQEWRDAWQEEIKATGQLSKYAATTPAEGLAEFGRIMYASGQSRDEVKKKYPKTLAVWEKHGL